MKRILGCLAFVGLALRGAACQAQVLPPYIPLSPTTPTGWRCFVTAKDVRKSLLASQISVDNQIGLDGSRVAVVTNRGNTTLVYTGYSPSSPGVTANKKGKGSGPRPIGPIAVSA